MLIPFVRYAVNQAVMPERIIGAASRNCRRRTRMLTTPLTPLDGQPDLAAYLPGAPPLTARRPDAAALRRRALLRSWRRQAPAAVAACSVALATVALYTSALLQLVVP
jgi:hypothetical protein